MYMLSVESSAVTASACLSEDGKVIKSEFINKGLTHSETLLPIIENVMQGVSYSNLGAIAVNAGPGSFTGVRIGIATVKGLAFPNNTPCISVSTLESIAYNFIDKNCVVCAVMDARRMQFYNALFRVENGNVQRLCDDRAISIEDLKKELKSYDNVIAAGDGARLFFENAKLDNITFADDEKVYQNAVGVSLAALNKEKISPNSLLPIYLRPSQAERELKLKKENKR